MAYAYQNLSVFTTAYAGCMGGIISGRRIADSISADYNAFASIAGAYAQSFDTQWGATEPDTLQLQMIQQVSKAVWENRNPSLNPGSTNPASYTTLVLAMIASIAAAESYFTGINVPVALADGTALNLYGSGQDGPTVILDGVNTFSFMSLVGSVYTLTRDIFPSTLRVTSGITLAEAGFRVFCRDNGTIDNGALVTADGNNAVGGTAGAASPLGTTGVGTGGGNGRANLTGLAGSNQGNTLTDASASGGAGGAGGANAGGAGGTYTPSATNGGANFLSSMLIGFLFSQTSGGNQAQLTIIGGGAGGGGGGSDNAGVTGGGGGGGAGVLVFHARNFVNNGTIRARGGNGAAASGAGGNGGGGGGGGGGIVLNLARTRSGSGTVVVDGGLGGAAVGTGVAGTAGNPGHVNAFTA